MRACIATQKGEVHFYLCLLSSGTFGCPFHVHIPKSLTAGRDAKRKKHSTGIALNDICKHTCTHTPQCHWPLSPSFQANQRKKVSASPSDVAQQVDDLLG